MMLTGNIFALKSVPSEEGPGTCFSSNTKGFFQKVKCFQKGPFQFECRSFTDLDDRLLFVANFQKKDVKFQL